MKTKTTVMISIACLGICGLLILTLSPYESPWAIPLAVISFMIGMYFAVTGLLNFLKIRIDPSKVLAIFVVLGILLGLHTLRQLSFSDVVLMAGVALILNIYLKGS